MSDDAGVEENAKRCRRGGSVVTVIDSRWELGDWWLRQDAVFCGWGEIERKNRAKRGILRSEVRTGEGCFVLTLPINKNNKK